MKESKVWHFLVGDRKPLAAFFHWKIQLLLWLAFVAVGFLMGWMK